ncbi:unnamed protein product [Calypogeia fissa]
MDPVQFNQWVIDRCLSDDEIDDALAADIYQSLDEEDGTSEMLEVLNRKHGESKIGQPPNIFRDHLAGHNRIWADYFSDTATYPARLFRRRFRMRRDLFMQIHNCVVEEDAFFVQREDALGRPGLSSLQKMVAALRIMCYGSAGDAVDENSWIKQ